MDTLNESSNLDENKTSKKEDDGSKEEAEKDKKAYNFFQKPVNSAQSYFNHFSWLQGLHSHPIPETVGR